MQLTGLDQPLAHAFDGKRAMITGGAGFIAQHLGNALLLAGAHVTLVGGCPVPEPPYLRGASVGAPFRRESRVGSEGFRRLLREERAFDYIFHLAGYASAAGSVQQPTRDFQANLAATYDLLDQLRELQLPSRLIFASTAAVYGNPVRLPICEQDPTLPISPYGVSKLAAERYVAVYARLYGISAASLRLFSVYGPGQRKQAVYDLFCKLHHSPDELVVLGDGTQVRDMIYVEDAVRAFLTVAARGRSDGHAYNVATGMGVATGDLARAIIAVQGGRARIRFTEQTRPGDPDCFLGSSAALAALGGAPRCSLLDGLRATAAWFNASVAELQEHAA